MLWSGEHGVPQHGHARYSRQQLREQLQLLRAHAGLIQENPCHVARGSRKAGGVTGSDWVALVVVADDRKGHGCLPRASYSVRVRGVDHLNADASELGSQFAEPLLSVRMPELDDEVLALDVPELPQLADECRHADWQHFSSGTRQKSHARHLPLMLCCGGERRGEGPSQRGQQEAAAVHAGMVGQTLVWVNVEFPASAESVGVIESRGCPCRVARAGRRRQPPPSLQATEFQATAPPRGSATMREMDALAASRQRFTSRLTAGFFVRFHMA